MRLRAWMLAVLLLVASLFAGVAAAQRARGPDGGGGGPWASLSMIAFVAAGVYVPLAFGRRVWLPRVLARGASPDLAAAGRWLRKQGTWLHMAFGTLTLVLGTVHGLTAGASNAPLWLGMACLAALLVLGVALQWLPAAKRHRGALLAVKWGIMAASLALLLLGHAAVHGPRAG